MEKQLHNASINARNYFENVYNIEEMQNFHRAVCEKYNMDRIFTTEDVMYLLYEFEEIVKFAIENFSDNVSVMAAINYNNAEKEYYNYINENY